MAKQKMTKKQREARAKAAEERERRQKEAQERATRTKRIFTIIVCAVLVLALGLPTVGLALCSSQQVEQAAVEAEQAVEQAEAEALAEAELAAALDTSAAANDNSKQAEGAASTDAGKGNGA